jgi:predicted unusual protein kinase regulating ubiquinone biosynthesis (AarF/ABC1/UbiB family)
MKLAKSLFKITFLLSAFYIQYLFNRKRLPELLSKTLIRLGPVYIKIGQVISTRRDIISEKYIQELSGLCNDVPAENSSEIERILDKTFPQGREHVFSNFNDKPIAAGAVAQVYSATLISGEKVAVKVLRPGIRKVIDDNFLVIKFLVSTAEKFNSNIKAINLIGIVAELEELLTSQCDLLNELKNLEMFNDIFALEQGLKVPKAYREISNSEVLVSEFFEAIHPHDYHRLEIDRKTLASQVDFLLDTMIFRKGLCHADMHPGNFFWTDQGDLVLIDFGLVHAISYEARNHIIVFYFAIYEGFYDFSTQYFIDHFVTPCDPSKEYSEDKNRRLFEDISKLVHEHFEYQPVFSTLFYQLLKVMAQHQIIFKPYYSKLFLTLITIEGYIGMLDSEFDMIENTRKKRMILAEYASIPEEAEKIVFSDFATYSTALFRDECSPQEAFHNRNKFVIDSINLEKDQFVIDVGCGRGAMLQSLKNHSARALGITISRVEYEVCLDRNLECVWSSWEEFDKITNNTYPTADAIVVIEILVHLASLFENKAGLFDMRLERFFSWCHKHLKDQGKLYIQALIVPTEYVNQTHHVDTYNKLIDILPFFGCTTLKQLMINADKYFYIKTLHNHSEDLLPTYEYFRQKIDENEAKLRKLIKPDVYEYINQELNALTELAQKGILNLNRILMIRKPEYS